MAGLLYIVYAPGYPSKSHLITTDTLLPILVIELFGAGKLPAQLQSESPREK